MQKAYKEGGQTCIDCHKGIAHKLPDMTAGFKAIHDELASDSKSLTPSVGSTLYTLSTKPFWLDRPKSADGAGSGKLLPLTPLEVLDRDGAWVKVKFAGWQQEGAERMVYAAQGKRIFAAALGPDAIDKVGAWPDDEGPRHGPAVDRSESRRLDAQAMTSSPTRSKLWDYGAEMYNASCGLCHSLPPTGNYLANQWIGNLNAMKRNISLDDEQYRFLQKYVQIERARHRRRKRRRPERRGRKTMNDCTVLAVRQAIGANSRGHAELAGRPVRRAADSRIRRLAIAAGRVPKCSATWPKTRDLRMAWRCMREALDAAD